MKYRYIKIGGSFIWGVNDLTKERFVRAVQMGDIIIDLEEMKYFDKDENTWKDIEGDK